MSDSASREPPSLPPRRSPVPLAPALLPENSSYGSSSTSIPPPLPPRSSPSRPAPPPLSIPDEAYTIPNGSSPEITVAITPATPPENDSPIIQKHPSTRQRAEELRPSPESPNEGQNATSLQNPGPAPPPPASDQSPSRKSHAPSPATTQRWPPTKSDPIAGLPSSLPSLDPKQWIHLLILSALMLNLLYTRLSAFWLLVLGVLYWVSNRLDTLNPAGSGGSGEFNGRNGDPGQGNPAVNWVNHAMYALFPLISTEVLTPFIDLLEDALMEQVPQIVTSVRLTSASLGNQPFLLTSMRPLTDQEWFAEISSTDHKASAERKGEIKATAGTDLHKAKSHLAGMTSSRRGKPSSYEGVTSSVSASSAGSANNSNDVARQTQTRQMRDQVVQSITRRRVREARQSRDDGEAQDGIEAPMMAQHMTSGASSSRTGENPVSEANKPDGERIIGAMGDSVEQDDPNAGQYVNYQIGFEYVRKESTHRKGWGLHVLGYFGIGVKGVGKAEIPVYIDMLSVKGTANARILLSATPPFVRNATVSLPSLPDFDISAHPLKLGTFNAMQLPGMKSYIRTSVLEVAEAFLRPASYTVDIDRLLLGREAALRTHTVGVLHLIIHRAEDLPKTDAVGSTDAYVSISFSKYSKPLYSTRTIVDTLNPSWEEPAFILISADAIQSGERLRLRLVDSDRLSADDAIGMVELDLATLIDETNTSDVSHRRRHDAIKADKPGMNTSGSLEWSVRFCPLWQMPLEEMSKRLEDQRKTGHHEPVNPVPPRWMEWIGKLIEDKPDWEETRAVRRKETLAWFTGEKERDDMEAATPPSDKFRSGVLQFHIHQCTDLEIESLAGTFSSDLNHRKSAASGKPALADVIDRTPAENPDPPSSYCEVHINDQFIYRTRTKQVTPLPYFNAVSERFIRDWRMAKIVFVVRDDRDREHDPILGLVSMHLRDALADRSQFTRWFPIVGGLGWGRIRISLLWKPIDISLPPGVSGYEIATLEVLSMSATDVGKHTERNLSVTIETETDKFTLAFPVPGDDIDGHRSSLSINSMMPPATTPSSIKTNDLTELEWEITKPIRLAVEYRHSCSVLVSFVTRSSVLKKKRVIGLATIRLNDCPDGEECHQTVPVFATAEVKEAMHAAVQYHALRNGGESRQAATHAQDDEAKLIGFVSLSFVIHPGVSRAHRKMCKRDLRFKNAYEAWEAAKEVHRDQKQTSVGEILRSNKHKVANGEDEESDESDSEDEYDVESVRRRDGAGEAVPGQAMIDDQDEEDAKEFMPVQKAHSHALHKRNKGIFQLKIARTGKFVKDKMEAKLLSSSKQIRHQGADMDVELEGQSSL